MDCSDLVTSIEFDILETMRDCLDEICNNIDSHGHTISAKMCSNAEDKQRQNGAISTSIDDMPSSDGENDDEFSWGPYFLRTGVLPVNVLAFKHVENSFRIVNEDGQHSCCSVEQASVSACSNDRSTEPIDAVEVSDQSSSTNPVCVTIDAKSNSVDGTGVSNRCKKLVFETISTERFVDVQDEHDPRHVWPAEILENVGGRLLLKYICIEDAGPPFWEFYLSERIHSAGICETDLGQRLSLQYALPSSCKTPGLKLSDDAAAEMLKITKAFTLNPELFKDRPTLQPHSFETGMWLESLDPVGFSLFYPARVVEVLNAYYFVVEYDTSMIAQNSSDSVCLRRACHYNSFGLFPVGFSAQRGLRFAAPDGFDWASYLRKNGGKLAPERFFFKTVAEHESFRRGFRLEAVNPSAPHQICAATIVNTMENAIWFHLDSSNHLSPLYVADCRSTNLFPCGWCAINGYPLKPPCQSSCRDFTSAQKELRDVLAQYRHSSCSEINAKHAYMPNYLLPAFDCQWTPAIYINGRCYTGPRICRFRLNEKAKCVGPGPMVMVLKTVASYLISAAYRPRELLAEFQPTGHTPPSCRQVVDIKAKYKMRHWRGQIEICIKPEQVPEWCRQLCVILETCPNLLGFKPYSQDKCPFECNRTQRTKYLGIAKPLSFLAAKRLKTRLAVQQRRQDLAAGAEPLRRRLRPSKPPTEPVISRPVTRGAKLPRSSDFSAESSKSNKLSTPSNTAAVDDTQEFSSGASISSNVDQCTCSSCLEPEADESTCSSWSLIGRESPTGYDSAVEGKPDHEQSKERHRTAIVSSTTISVTLPPVESNPLEWTPSRLHNWLRKTVIGIGVADRLREELVDGQAFMLMDIRDIQEYLGLKLGPTLKVCGVIKELKNIYLSRFAARGNESSVNGCATLSNGHTVTK